MKEQILVEIEGTVAALVRNAVLVNLDSGAQVYARLSGKLMLRSVRVVAGDRVVVAITPYDVSKGRVGVVVGSASVR
jgi:translation initiation factor IF-1